MNNLVPPAKQSLQNREELLMLASPLDVLGKDGTKTQHFDSVKARNRDQLMQRFKMVESAILDSSWEIANGMNLLDEEMPSRPPCQRCRRRPGSRRLCPRCLLQLGPCCFPKMAGQEVCTVCAEGEPEPEPIRSHLGPIRQRAVATRLFRSKGSAAKGSFLFYGIHTVYSVSCNT